MNRSVALLLCLACAPVALAQLEIPPTTPQPSLQPATDPQAPKPEVSPELDAPATKPAIDPATLPAPTLGLVFKDERIINALKLVEHSDFDQARALLEKALRESISTDRIVRDELNLGLAMVELRAGQLAKANLRLNNLTTINPPDTSVRDLQSVTRRAEILQTIAQVAPKPIKDQTPLSSAEGWTSALRLASKKITDLLRDDHKQIQRHADANSWTKLLTYSESARTHMEQLDCLQDAGAVESWNDVAKLHSNGLVETVAKIARRHEQLQVELSQLRRRMRRSNAEDAWVPIEDVNRFNTRVRELQSARATSLQLLDHFAKARSKWPAGGIFAIAPFAPIDAADIPAERRPAMRDKDPR